MTKRFAVKIAYLGKNYQGFQRQKGSIPTIEEEITTTLKELEIIESLSKAQYTAAGRTDAGVNALGQVIAFDSLRDEIYLEELNQHLPNDIYAWAITTVNSDFNARKNATQRFYRYFASYNNENIKLMKQAARKLVGNHDFIKLCKTPDRYSDGSKKSTTITLEKAEISLNKEKNLLQFDFSSRSFLWKQVRKMVSLLVAIGRKEYPLSIIDDVFDLASKEPKGGIKPAPPVGLVLYKVDYTEIVFTLLKKKSLIENLIRKEISNHSSTLAVLRLIEKQIIK